MSTPTQTTIFDAAGAAPAPVVLQDIDLHFGRFMAGLGDGTDQVMLAAALPAHWNDQGHSCVDLGACAGALVQATPGGEPRRLPGLDAWLGALRGARVVGGPGAERPLVLDGQRLYLHRYWAYEQEVAGELRERAHDAPLLEDAALRRELARFFPDSGGGTDWQKVAGAIAVRRRLCVISGGPGTGKTSTVLRILALLAVGRAEPLRIQLAAPTGKASVRMQESIEKARFKLGLEARELARVPERAVTLHRLLGARPGSASFYHDRDNPLPVDLLVLDEASMIDLALMARLLRALPPHAHLVLLGDHHQLASVEAGAVLGDICSVSAGFSRQHARWLSDVTGETLAGGAAVHPLSDSIVFLQRSYRFGPDSGIGELSRRINAGDAEGVIEVLQGGAYDDLAFDDRPVTARRLVQRMLEGYAPLLGAAARGTPDASLFQALDRFRVLCAVREGPSGVTHLNREVESRLPTITRGRGALWYPGRPVLVTRNDYALRLYNGDTGVAVAEGNAFQICFPASAGGVRTLAPGRLPEHETAFAMTVHKAQGSEFRELVLVLPPASAAVLTRELIYTAVTRARRGVRIAAPPAVLAAAVRTPSRRVSGLAQALTGQP